MQVRIQKLHPDVEVPAYATAGAACFDLHAMLDGGEGSVENVMPGSNTLIGSGLAFEVPRDHVMLLFSRSGHGHRDQVRLSNCVAVIDSDYRGEVMVPITSDAQPPVSPFGASRPFTILHGMRIAQGMVLPIEQAEFVVEETLSETTRGTGGFGSTGQ